ncbi:MAG: TIGR00270 family protein [Nitrososphaerota archaeon]|jgi:putative transcription factor|nr:TIGR00270 family protein [Nitrososphaerota archaeon]MDG7046010.1 TIGR00270 family protein [Nitrososphaerota archaeon]
MQCELCGREIVGTPFTISIDGAVLNVCSTCSRFGKRISTGKPRPRTAGLSTRTAHGRVNQTEAAEEEFQLLDDYNVIIRKKRESMELTQSQFGMKLGVKPSLVAKLESGRIKPDIALAKKIENALKIRLSA